MLSSLLVMIDGCRQTAHGRENSCCQIHTRSSGSSVKSNPREDSDWLSWVRCIPGPDTVDKEQGTQLARPIYIATL